MKQAIKLRPAPPGERSAFLSMPPTRSGVSRRASNLNRSTEDQAYRCWQSTRSMMSRLELTRKRHVLRNTRQMAHGTYAGTMLDHHINDEPDIVGASMCLAYI